MASKSLKQMLLGLTVVLFSFVLVAATPSLATPLSATGTWPSCIGVVGVLIALGGVYLAFTGFSRDD